jgi:hypothetical protein
MNNERLFTKKPGTQNSYIDSLTNHTVALTDIKVGSILENGNKILGTLHNTQVPTGNTTIHKTNVVVAAVDNRGHSTASLVGAGLAGAALGAGAGYLLSRDNNEGAEETTQASEPEETYTSTSDDNDSSWSDDSDSSSGDDEE